MWDYEKLSVVTYPFYFINWQSIHKTNCMQRIKKFLMWEVLPTIALKMNLLLQWKFVTVFDKYMLTVNNLYVRLIEHVVITENIQ